ncbi:hypothetical protein BKA65DRAFT_199616 [Rhexocercosporidium sp. MPI-PUGE-AT-0058]|nr:hypothetical protein BKA65DRAFT_199616 [Rhexocercosporidium sp. MPI-PUGE-AT-0058]
MSTTAPTSPSPLNSRDTLYHNIALGALIVCPIVILIPPRKLDIYTVALTAGFFAGGNHLASHYTGASIAQRFATRMESMSNHNLPPKAMETQRRLKEERERRDTGGLANPLIRINTADDKGVLAEMRRKENEEKERGLLEKVWMGNEGSDWKAKRDQKEKEALDEGRGYGGLIMDQIWEVWSWGKDKAEDVKEIDEKVVQEKKEGKK